MPKVSQEHLDARRTQILDAATRCFARQGFHATTMADVLTESGLSAGAVYRYFRGKNELVSAVAEQVLDGAYTRLESVLLAESVPTPADAVHGVVAAIDPGVGHDEHLRMAVQVWGEALRDDNLAQLAGAGYGRIRAIFVDYARRAIAAGLLPEGTDAVAAGSAYFSLVPGYMLQRLLLRDTSPAGYAVALRSVLA
ncbi:TetR/AcrR family transcriptional regulator [Mycolicibacterium sp. PDY-3]|uniref:TetR/AcrR family transcriptional regulator n=1 Tax=Mycolicibacterium sp. PDY-3 TaxID=3376069 RepID=UPI0037A82931